MAEETTVTPQEETTAVEAVAPAAAPAVAPTPVRNSSDLAPELAETGEEAPRKEVANGRAYEVTYIVRAHDAAALENTQARVRELIDGVDGAVDNVRVSEVRRLAYPIAKQTDGVYVVINARFEKSLTEELDRYFKIDETVLRHLVLRDE